jgi:hypothetical protein
MEQKEKPGKADPSSTQLEDSVGHGKENEGQKVETSLSRRVRCWGGWRGQQRGCTVRKVGSEGEKLSNRRRKGPITCRVAVKAREKKRLWSSHLGKKPCNT